MQSRLAGVILFAVLVALGASVVLYQLLIRRLGSGPDGPSAQVLVATRDLAVGAVVGEQDVETVKWGGPVPPGAIQKKEDIVGRAAVVPTYRGGPIVDANFAPKGAGAGLAVTIPPGKRAVAVKVDQVVGLAGFVLPGMHVDVIATGDPPDKSKEVLGTQARTILQNIEVLSAGQNLQPDREGKPVPVQVVNLLVTPEEAEILSLAGNETRIQLVLRNPLDKEKVEPPGTATAYLFSGRPAGKQIVPPKPPGYKPPPPKMQTVVVPVKMEIIAGAKKEEVKVGEIVEERPASEAKK
ncbi:MAG: Flp pilus assembly protein CpaB [Acidobacteriota bacterium]